MNESRLDEKTKLTEWELTRRHFSTLGQFFKEYGFFRGLIWAHSWDVAITSLAYFHQINNANNRIETLRMIYGEETPSELVRIASKDSEESKVVKY